MSDQVSDGAGKVSDQASDTLSDASFFTTPDAPEVQFLEPVQAGQASDASPPVWLPSLIFFSEASTVSIYPPLEKHEWTPPVSFNLTEVRQCAYPRHIDLPEKRSSSATWAPECYPSPLSAPEICSRLALRSLNRVSPWSASSRRSRTECPLPARDAPARHQHLHLRTSILVHFAAFAVRLAGDIVH